MVIPTPGFEGEAEAQPDFVDDPLDPVVQDDMDISLVIGGRLYLPVELEVHLTEGSESNYAMGLIRPDGHDHLPSAGDPLNEGDQGDRIKIDVDTLLMSERDDANEEITRIFTGIISNASRVENGLFEFMAFWPGFNEIQNGELLVSHPPPEEGEVGHQGEQYAYPGYNTSVQYTREIAQEVAEQITGDLDGFSSTINLREDGWDVGSVNYGMNVRQLLSGFHIPLTVEGSDEGILSRITHSSNAVWDVDRYGTFHIGPPVPSDEYPDIPTAVTTHKLRYITGTSAGIRSPAYRSVVVIGDGVVSQDGWGAGAQLNENPQEYANAVTDAYKPEDPSDELAEPTFEYTNLEINTAEEAQHVLSKIVEDIRKQMAGGEITVVGHPEVWPGDAVELPDSRNQPYGLERFGVSKVVHRLNNQDGFMTKIEVMGQTNANETAFLVREGEVDPSRFENDRYDSYYSEDELEAVRERRRSGL